MFIVYDKDLNIKPFPQGVRPLDIYIHSINKQATRDSVEGRSGVITKGITHVNRPIEIKYGLLAHDTIDYRMLRDAAYDFFDDDEYYVAEAYQPGKLYKVTKLQSSIPSRLSREVAEETFMLDMVDLPYSSSLGTTQDIQRNGINANDDLWGFGMGLIADEESLFYTHTGTSFKIYNAGSAPIHPFEQELKITIDQIQGSISFFELWNMTTNDKFRVNEAASGTIMLDGPNILRGGFSYLRSTNMNFIGLAPGWNQFNIIGASSARVAFDFPFYYK